MSISENLLETIKRIIPQGVTPSVYVADILNIGYDSAVRRLNGQVKFSLDEIAILAKHLNFSIDNSLGIKVQQEVPFKLHLLQNDDLSNIFKKKLSDLIQDLRKARTETGAIRAYLALNTLCISFVLPSKYIFKFLLYRWLHQMGGIKSYTKMEDFIVSQDIIEIQEEYIKEIKLLNEATVIFEKDVYLSIVYSINYFRKKGLINCYECNKLKEDLRTSISLLNNIAKHNTTSTSTKVDFYISLINISTTYSLYESRNNMQVSQFSVYSIFTLDSRNKTVCRYQKEWFDSLKRFSIKISGCNEYERESFFNNQIEIVNKINL